MQLNGIELEHTNMRDVFLARRSLGDKPLLICDGETLTYAGADEASNRIADSLAGFGIGKGDVVQNCFSYHLTPAGMMFENGCAFQVHKLDLAIETHDQNLLLATPRIPPKARLSFAPHPDQISAKRAVWPVQPYPQHLLGSHRSKTRNTRLHFSLHLQLAQVRPWLNPPPVDPHSAFPNHRKKRPLRPPFPSPALLLSQNISGV